MEHPQKLTAQALAALAAAMRARLRELAAQALAAQAESRSTPIGASTPRTRIS
jgi:hypothetical protein